MRTDCIIDSRPIPCPNADVTGYGLAEANVGNLIGYTEYYEDGTTGRRVARVLGRVSAPKLSSTDRAVKGFALVMALSDDCTHAYERWVDPADILTVRTVPTQLLEFFARPVLPETQSLRLKMQQGYVVDQFLPDSGL